MDALEFMARLPDQSVDAVITDPPYAEVDRDYGRLTEKQWRKLMYPVVMEMKRILKPTGSAVVIIQPNSKHVGTMRPWVWDFMAWSARRWNIVQDVYWWNTTTPPNVHTHADIGLMRTSVKNCVWLGNSKCYRNQDAVLWRASDSTKAMDISDRSLKHYPSGLTIRKGRIAVTTQRRGGSTPFNVLPFPNANSTNSAGSHGHGAGTPETLVDWWIRYITKAGDVILDPFMGSGTTALSAQKAGRHFVGCDSSAEYIELARKRIAAPYTPPLFTDDVKIAEITQ